MSTLRRRTTGAAMLAVGVAVTLGGCGGQTTVRSGDVTMFVHRGSILPGSGMDGIAGGELGLLGGCVVLHHGAPDSASPVVWPAGTSLVDDDPLTIRLPSGERVTEGQTVAGGGGYVSPERVDLGIPAECIGPSDQVGFFNRDADVRIEPGAGG